MSGGGAVEDPGNSTCPGDGRGRPGVESARLDHVVVALPYFRCRTHIRACVESVLDQTHRDLTLIVVNDADPHVPWDVLADVDDHRLVRFSLQRNRGRYFADQVVLAATDAPFVLVQDADDWSEPARVETLLRALRRRHAGVALSATLVLGDGDTPARVVPPTRVHRPLGERLQHRAAYHGLYRADVVRAAGGFFGGFTVGYDTFLLSAVAMLAAVATVDAPLYHRRRREGSLTTAPATGFRSTLRANARRRMQAMYRQAFAAYADYLEGRSSHEMLASRIREVTAGHVSQGDRSEIAEEARRLRATIAAGASATPASETASRAAAAGVLDEPPALGMAPKMAWTATSERLRRPSADVRARPESPLGRTPGVQTEAERSVASRDFR